MTKTLLLFLVALWSMGIFSMAEAQQELSLTLSWTDTANNEKGFRVYRRMETDPAPAPLHIDIPTADVQQYQDIVPDGNIRYCYTVTAYNVAGESGPSNEACSKTFAEIPPTTPTGLQVSVVVTVTVTQ